MLAHTHKIHTHNAHTYTNHTHTHVRTRKASRSHGPFIPQSNVCQLVATTAPMWNPNPNYLAMLRKPCMHMHAYTHTSIHIHTHIHFWKMISAYQKNLSIKIQSSEIVLVKILADLFNMHRILKENDCSLEVEILKYACTRCKKLYCSFHSHFSHVQSGQKAGGGQLDTHVSLGNIETTKVVKQGR